MATIPFTCIAPADPQGSARRRELQKRMRIATLCFAASGASLLAGIAQTYMVGGILPAAGLLIAGTLFLFEAFRQADRLFLAPLQAQCQDDYSRQIDALLRPLLGADGIADMGRTQNSE
jgi:hypothetical protein